MIVSRIESGKPIVVPPELLAAAGLRDGDEVAIGIVGDRIVVVPTGHGPDAFVSDFSTFTEWESEEDCAAFDDEAFRPIVDAALRDTGPSYSADEVFAELHARIDGHRRQADAA